MLRLTLDFVFSEVLQPLTVSADVTRESGGCRSHLQIINSLSQDTTLWLMMSIINHWPPSTPDLRSPPGDQPPTYTQTLIIFIQWTLSESFAFEVLNIGTFFSCSCLQSFYWQWHCFVFPEFNSIDFHFNCVNRFLWKTSAFIWILISTSMRPQSRVSHKSVNHN